MARKPTRTPDSDEVAVALDRATRSFRRAEDAFDRQRQALYAEMVAAEAQGMTKSEIARRVGFTREYTSELLTRLKRAREEAEAARG